MNKIDRDFHIEMAFSKRLSQRSGWSISTVLTHTFECTDKGFKMFVFPGFAEGWRFKIESPDGVVKSRNKPFQSPNEAFWEAEKTVYDLQQNAKRKTQNAKRKKQKTKD